MKIMNLGSLNLDKVYAVRHFVQAGETVLADCCEVHCGGKGLNQSIALAKAGAEVLHLGKIGPDGTALEQILSCSGVDVSLLLLSENDSGHAIIQVNTDGQNSIIVYGGANQEITPAEIDQALTRMCAGDLFLTQNETSCVPYALQKAKKVGLKTVFNPSPITQELLGYPLELVDLLILNETEAEALAGHSGSYAALLELLVAKYPSTEIILTAGKDGSYYGFGGCRVYQQAIQARAVDTTGAGDTYCGYFIASRARGMEVKPAMELASRAAAIAVSRKGAASSIPSLSELK